MKKFLKEKRFILILWLIIILIFVFGGMYSKYVTNQLHDEAAPQSSSTLVIPETQFDWGGYEYE